MRSRLINVVLVLTVIGSCGSLWGQTSDEPSISEADHSIESIEPPVKTNYLRATQDWDSLVSSFKSHGQVPEVQMSAFVRAAINAVPESATEGWTVCSAVFTRLAGSDSPTLIASMDINGRRFCNFIFVITRSETAVLCQGVYVWMVPDVRNVLTDIRKDGKIELAVPTEASDYQGDRCMTTWIRVLILEHGTLVDRSSDFKAFYRTRLDKIIDELPSALADDQTDGLDRAVCLQMEADRIRRFVGDEPKEGEDRALKWVNSTTQSLRLKGVMVLAQIGDKKSKAALEKLTHDGDPLIAMTAKQYLGEKVSEP